MKSSMQWLLLTYRIPRQPTAGRVYVWRKLKALGAVSLQDASWLLPATPRTQEQLQWLAAEIRELGGEAVLFHADAVLMGDEASLVEQFVAPVREAYTEMLAQLKERKPDLAALSKQYQETVGRDYFRCPLREKVRDKLLSAQGNSP